MSVPLEAAEADEVPIRARRRAQARRSFFPKTRNGRLLWAAAALAALGMLAFGLIAARNFFEHDARFRIENADAIEVIGNHQVTRQELLTPFDEDIGRNIFFVPLRARRAELEELPWVERATVMRLLPNRLRVAVVERTPVAFVRHGNRIGLVDANGVLLSMPPAAIAARRYSFPVVTGISASLDPEVRADRMRLYERFLSEIDADGAHASTQISEVDLSDPEDVRATLSTGGLDLLVHFGDLDFARRFEALQEHLPAWKQQYPQLAGVDLRYEHQTVLEMANAAPDGAATPTESKHPAKAQPRRAPGRSGTASQHAARGAQKGSGKGANSQTRSARLAARG